ncbi:hypothetical protein [Streptomyces europaeiscabiei]|uniref:hypothetical protein n=1 Tax=Streptomyces europaeiscabiei TaxID=146819 RepID=UPI0007659776|nr:hypothetical protein [Streptomyces europaeiscabiei]MDX2529804.1 hypothetical protein [Streptomyces europaeiscabiei]MDX3665584.1 hypothetical protein [Streptomyces europaeiscabiei]MDX3836212.1 hypothetical protein [Streptomyces europaeiscabiei]MDX3862113.1 hypothetical protein [Streptomyces europaeiscabiei]MDX3873413.1 hypothetical protein [Streptomyces europaeiscabiei]
MKQLRTTPAIVTAVQPPAVHSTGAAAEKIAPPSKSLATKAVLGRQRASFDTGEHPSFDTGEHPRLVEQVDAPDSCQATVSDAVRFWSAAQEANRRNPS